MKNSELAILKNVENVELVDSITVKTTFSTVSVMSDRIYVFEGLDGGLLSLVEIRSIVNNSWTAEISTHEEKYATALQLLAIIVMVRLFLCILIIYLYRIYCKLCDNFSDEWLV